LITNEFSYNLSGNVRHQGLPVAGVAVQVMHAYDGLRPELSEQIGEQLDRQTTNTKGEFNFAVQPGIYRVEFTPSAGTRFVRQVIKQISVLANTTISINLATGLLLHGRVLNADGQPISNGSVVAFSNQ